MLWKLMQRQQQIMDSRNRRTPALTAQYCKDFQYWTTWSSLLLINISNVCDRVWHTGLFYKLKSYGISSRIFSLILSFLSNRQLRVVLDGKSSQEYPVNAGVPQGSILGPTLFLLYINDLPDVICATAISADDTTLYSKCDQAPDLWQQLKLACELKSDLWNTVDWGRK